MKEFFTGAGPFLLIGGLALAFWLVARIGPNTPRQVAVRAKPLLTPNEREFFHRLRRALPGYEVLPQVSMGALLDADLPPEHPRIWTIRRVFAMKIADFVLCEPGTLRVIAVVELDDKSHDAKLDNDARRDVLLASAGISTLRWDSRKKPSESEIFACVDKLPRRDRG